MRNEALLYSACIFIECMERVFWYGLSVRLAFINKDFIVRSSD
jgi:hypothetical protein